MINNDLIFGICKYASNNEIINIHLACNIPIQIDVIRLMEQYKLCESCRKYETKLLECIRCNKLICAYCQAKCAECNTIRCNAYKCGDHNSKNKNPKTDCKHNFKSQITIKECRNHNKQKCSDCKRLACECMKGGKCIKCWVILCENCDGICENCY